MKNIFLLMTLLLIFAGPANAADKVSLGEIKYYSSSNARVSISSRIGCGQCHDIFGRKSAGMYSQKAGYQFGGGFAMTSHHVYKADGTVENSDCLVCHDLSQHASGVVRVKDADTGLVSDYVPSSPASIENFCLSCHDTDGANGNMSPFSDGKTLGSVPYRASVDIKANWNKTYGHRVKGLTCLGDGSPDTGCHISAHGSDYPGLLARSMVLPILAWAPYDYNQYRLCFDCHENYPNVTKEVVLGYKQGGNFDVWWAPTPYYTAEIKSKFRDRFCSTWYGCSFPTYWGGVDQPYNYNMWWDQYEPLHNWHLSPTEGWMQSLWKYRGSIVGRASCQTCHNVHGSNTEWGWLYDEMKYKHYSGLGPDLWATMEMDNLDGLYNHPTNCNWNCHGKGYPTDPMWYYPSGE